MTTEYPIPVLNYTPYSEQQFKNTEMVGVIPYVTKDGCDFVVYTDVDLNIIGIDSGTIMDSKTYKILTENKIPLTYPPNMPLIDIMSDYKHMMENYNGVHCADSNPEGRIIADESIEKIRLKIY